MPKRRKNFDPITAIASGAVGGVAGAITAKVLARHKNPQKSSTKRHPAITKAYRKLREAQQAYNWASMGGGKPGALEQAKKKLRKAQEGMIKAYEIVAKRKNPVTINTLEKALKWLKRDGYIFDIGQISPKVRRKLNALAKRGVIVKEKARWPFYLWGTTEKTLYYVPDFSPRSLAATEEAQKFRYLAR